MEGDSGRILPGHRAVAVSQQFFIRRSVMFKLLILILSMSYLTQSWVVYSTIEYMLETELAGVYEDTLSSGKLDSVAIAMLGSRKKGDIFGDEFQYTGVEVRFSFSRFPCISMYRLERQPVSVLTALNPDWVLFNSCDSTIYQFGIGSLTDFRRVMRSFLKDSLNQSSIIEMLSLYLNTRSIGAPITILTSYEDFDNLFGKPGTFDAGPLYSDEERMRDRRLVKKTLKPMRLVKSYDTYEAEFYTWCYATGNIEHWFFEISPVSLQLFDHSVVLENIGPYRGRLHQ